MYIGPLSIHLLGESFSTFTRFPSGDIHLYSYFKQGGLYHSADEMETT